MKPHERFEPKTQLTVVGIPVLYVHPDWTTPEASQVFQAAGSERQASALQIHHLSLPLSFPLESQFQPRRRKGGGRGGREVEETAGLVGRAVIRHYTACLPMPAGQSALFSHQNGTEYRVRDGCLDGRWRQSPSEIKAGRKRVHQNYKSLY